MNSLDYKFISLNNFHPHEKEGAESCKHITIFNLFSLTSAAVAFKILNVGNNIYVLYYAKSFLEYPCPSFLPRSLVPGPFRGHPDLAKGYPRTRIPPVRTGVRPRTSYAVGSMSHVVSCRKTFLLKHGLGSI